MAYRRSSSSRGSRGRSNGRSAYGSRSRGGAGRRRSPARRSAARGSGQQTIKLVIEGAQPSQVARPGSYLSPINPAMVNLSGPRRGSKY